MMRRVKIVEGTQTGYKAQEKGLHSESDLQYSRLWKVDTYISTLNERVHQRYRDA